MDNNDKRTGVRGGGAVKTKKRAHGPRNFGVIAGGCASYVDVEEWERLLNPDLLINPLDQSLLFCSSSCDRDDISVKLEFIILWGNGFFRLL